MIRLTFLGTAAARPTVGRGVSSIAVQREADIALIDCGEGTQRQMMRYGSGFAVNRIFLTHIHADHFLGVVGLLRTLALQGREDPLHLYAPEGSSGVLRSAVRLGVERLPFEVPIHELQPEEKVHADGYAWEAFAVKHGTKALGYALSEPDRLGRFDVDRAHELGVPAGRLFGRLHAGESIEVEGRVIHPDEVVGRPRPGRRVVFSGDTRPCRSTIQAATGADVLVHEATFAAEETDRARQTGHSTTVEAAEVAASAGVRQLILTHISARYTDRPGTLEREARVVFPGAVVAYDGLTLEVPFPDESLIPAQGGSRSR